jgi:hypothetical protein
MEADIWDEPLMMELSQAMTDASICGLGQAAPNPVKSVFRYFRHELKPAGPPPAASKVQAQDAAQPRRSWLDKLTGKKS